LGFVARERQGCEFYCGAKLLWPNSILGIRFQKEEREWKRKPFAEQNHLNAARGS
jgi:hypothetical protein